VVRPGEGGPVHRVLPLHREQDVRLPGVPAAERPLDPGQPAEDMAAAQVAGRAGSPSGFDGRLVDLRVDDHAQPVAELARLLNVWRVAHALPPSAVVAGTTPPAP
jgi:hypothetical protein